LRELYKRSMKIFNGFSEEIMRLDDVTIEKEIDIIDNLFEIEKKSVEESWGI
jgi:hypothetical protein